jgi:hypothetical protein
MPDFTSNQLHVPAASGENTAGGDGLLGKSVDGGRGVAGLSDDWQGVYGHSVADAGVVGESDQFDGGFFISHSNVFSGVSGHNDAGTAVWGGSKTGRGVAGFTESWQGVYGHSISNAGVVGESDRFDGGFFVTHNPTAAGVSAHNPGGLAGWFDGNVVVTGDVQLPGADCAEEFGVIGPEVEPGCVMIIAEDQTLRQSEAAYDTRVAGVLAGGGDYQPGIVLDRCQDTSRRRNQLSLMGKVFCKVDAQYSPVRVGDMLTTSPTPGHAMAVREPHRAFGAVIGKALRPLDSGLGMIPILIALQ